MHKPLINPPKTKRGERTLSKLLKSAEMNFLEQGYYNTSIIDITQGAGVAMGTYYVYFGDKLSIYKYLLLQYSHQIRKQIALSMTGTESRKEAERIGLRAFLEYISINKHIYNIIWESLYIDKSLFVDYYRSFAHNYTLALDDSKEKGQIKDFDTEVVSYMLMGIANFIGLNWIMFQDKDRFDDVVDEVIRVLEFGLFSEPETSESPTLQ